MVDAMMVERRAACSFIPTMKKVTMTPLPSEPHLRTLEEGAGLAIYHYVMQQHVIMSSDEIESGNNDDNESTTSTFSTQRVMESVMRVSLAGFGGALAGLSLSRQRQSSRPRPVRVDSTLPMNWASACAGFCTLIEISRWASLTSLLSPSRRIQTIGDYTIGGAAAGAAFRGMQVAQKSTKTLRPNILSGLASGIVLGLIAGVVQCAADIGEEMVNEERARQTQSNGKEAQS
jgi:hypothetical protein